MPTHPTGRKPHLPIFLVVLFIFTIFQSCQKESKLQLLEKNELAIQLDNSCIDVHKYKTKVSRKARFECVLEQLREAGIEDIQTPIELLQAAGHFYEREQLSIRSSIHVTALTQAVEELDLMRTDMPNLDAQAMLAASYEGQDAHIEGVLNIHYLSLKDKHKFKKKVAKFIEENPPTVLYEVPSVDAIGLWIERAKELKTLVVYKEMP